MLKNDNMRLALLKNRLYVRAIENLIKQNKYHTLQYDTGYIHPKEYKKEVKKCVINQDKTLTVEELILINDIVKELGTTLKLFGNTQDQIEVLFSLKPHELERVAKLL